MDALSMVERFDIRSGTWNTLPSMCIPRKNAVAVVIDGEIAVIGVSCLHYVYASLTSLYAGGWDERSTLASIEIYNPTSNSWRMAPYSLEVPRECASAVS